jgi:TolA-binding protein
MSKSFAFAAALLAATVSLPAASEEVSKQIVAAAIEWAFANCPDGTIPSEAMLGYGLVKNGSTEAQMEEARTKFREVIAARYPDNATACQVLKDSIPKQ